jgi:predicted nucleic acid-binding protein
MEVRPAPVPVYLDADTLICGSVARTNAPHAILRLAEAHLIEGVVCVRACQEAEKNIVGKFPEQAVVARSLFRQIVACLTVVPTPTPEEVARYAGQADPKDLPHLTAAIRQHCQYLITYNVRHYHPEANTPIVLRPDEFLEQVRDILTQLYRIRLP